MPLSTADAPTTYWGAFRVYQRMGSVRLIALFLLLSLLLRLAVGDWRATDLVWLLLALLSWPLLEWSLHRYLLHLKPWRIGRLTLDPDFARKHRAHHAQPWIARLTFLPAYVPALLAPLLLWAAWAGGSPQAYSLLIGLGLAALNYEWTHWIVHTRIQPRNAYYRRVFQNHRQHHFRHEGYWFSFMLPALDDWLGTGPDPAQTPPSGTARNLHGLSDASMAAPTPR